MPPRNFDTDQDTRRAQRLDPENLQFTINGQTFHVLSGFAPEAAGADAIAEWRAMDEDVPNEEFAAIADTTILRFLTPGQEEKWKLARDPSAPNPVTGSDLVDIILWLLEAVVSRPLVPASPSSTGSTPPQDSAAPRAQTGMHLTAVSPSKAAASGA